MRKLKKILRKTFLYHATLMPLWNAPAAEEPTTFVVRYPEVVFIFILFCFIWFIIFYYASLPKTSSHRHFWINSYFHFLSVECFYEFSFVAYCDQAYAQYRKRKRLWAGGQLWPTLPAVALKFFEGWRLWHLEGSANFRARVKFEAIISLKYPSKCCYRS